MERVIGVGGIFFKSANPDALRAWYRQHLGLDIQDWGGTHFGGDPNAGAPLAWSIFDAASNSFAPSSASFMINYRVRDLHAVLAALRAEGCEVDERTDSSDFGKFGWVMDPDGNRVELWEPPAA
ncbi:VOC family protein [Solimonas terrae]|uniref:VOC family protein n=1 Tax=Solimonas terrae TaxID=1396819 RepID=A0A6M2BXL1_9GAMM|nr:VOC family protein [Solimonas terrae]NGY06873.1 VOC family protein [Solimonas terrae]